MFYLSCELRDFRLLENLGCNTSRPVRKESNGKGESNSYLGHSLIPRIHNFAHHGRDASTKETAPPSETPAHPTKDDAKEEAAMIGKYLRLADLALDPGKGNDDDAQKDAQREDKEAA